MKITAVEAIHLRAEDPLIELFDGSYDDCVLVVHTDEGLDGNRRNRVDGAGDPGHCARPFGA